MENSDEQALKNQKVWESLILPKGYYLESKLFHNPILFFVIKGTINLKINKGETYPVFSREMFMAQIDNTYGITMLEPTQLLVCHIPLEAWFVEQKWIDGLIKDEKVSEEFCKLHVKKIIFRFLSLLSGYLKEIVYPSYFFELKRQELFFLIFAHYAKPDLARFLQGILSNDIQFKMFVINNHFNAKNVQELAKSANYSTSGFIKKFQNCFNDSPYRWMQKQKAKHIFIEINRGVKSLQEIASEYKFSSYQHFSVFCKLQLGSPPTEILSQNKLKRAVNS